MAAGIGRVLLISKGTYSGSTVYNMLDWVRYDNKAWVCKVDGTVGITPVEGANWTLMAADGSVSGNVNWSNVSNKPFATVDSNDFDVDANDELNIKRNTFGKMRIVSGGSTTDLEASGDSVFEIDAGSNVTITADDSSTPKKITINSTGGGGGSSTFAGLSDVSLSGSPTAGQIVQYTDVSGQIKLRNVAMPTGGHTMIPTTNDIATITALQNGNDNYVINAYSAKRWSNTDSITLLTTVAQGDDTMGTWTDTWETDGDRTGWLCHSLLADILSDNDTEIELVFDIADSETVSAYAYRIDDHYTVNGETVGGIAIKFNGAIQNASGVKVGVKLKHNRATYINVSRT